MLYQLNAVAPWLPNWVLAEVQGGGWHVRGWRVFLEHLHDSFHGLLKLCVVPLAYLLRVHIYPDLRQDSVVLNLPFVIQAVDGMR